MDLDVDRRRVLGGALALGVSSAAWPAAGQAIIGQTVPFSTPPPWYRREPLRVSWHILRDIDGGQSGADIVDQAVAANVNAVCVTVGGSRAFYPTRVPFHQRSSALPPGRDLVGEIAAAAKARGVRLFARFDFSQQPEETWRAHPEWFYKKEDGSFITGNGRYRPCLNAGFYRQQAPAIVAEVVERYRPAFIFINNFSNTASRRDTTPCLCESCTSAWERRFPGKPMPASFTPDYLLFMNDEAQKTAGLIQNPIRRRRPDIVIINADAEPSDGMHTESRMLFPGASLWPYESAAAVDRQLNSRPDKVTLGLCISYSSNYSRAVLMPPAETRVHMYQVIASGSHPAYAMTGTFDQYDPAALAAAKEVFAWHKRHEDIYVGQRNAARVLLLAPPSVRNRVPSLQGEGSLRSLYGMLAEGHVPFALAETEEPLLRRPGQYDVVVVTRGAPLAAVERYVRAGGRALYVDQHPGFAVPRPVGTLAPEETSAYWRVRSRTRLPGFPDAQFLIAGGGRLDVSKTVLQLYPPEPGADLTLVPPMAEEPAEVAMSNVRDLPNPGLIWRDVGQGRLAFLPWDIGGLYTAAALETYPALLMSVLRELQGANGGEIETDAAPAVQMILMEQAEKNRKLLHLVNLTGQSQRGFDNPARTGPIRITLRGAYRSVESRALEQSLPVSSEQGRTTVTLPSLGGFDSLVFTPA